MDVMSIKYIISKDTNAVSEFRGKIVHISYCVNDASPLCDLYLKFSSLFSFFFSFFFSSTMLGFFHFYDLFFSFYL